MQRHGSFAIGCSARVPRRDINLLDWNTVRLPITLLRETSQGHRFRKCKDRRVDRATDVFE